VARVLSLALCLGFGCVSPRSAQRPDKPIQDPARRYEFPGFSVLPPQGPRWVVSPVTPAEPASNLALVPQSNLLVFSRRLEQSVTSDPRSMHRALITVGTRDLGAHPVKTLQEYLAFEQKRMAELVGTQVAPTFRLLSSKFEVDATMPNCLRFEQTAEDKGVPEFPGVPFISQIRGYRCLHPQWPRYVVSVAYDDEHLSGVEPFHVDAEIEPALHGLRLTQERPVFVTTIPVGLGAQGVAVFEGSVWVAWGDNGVARVDSRTNEVAELTVGRDPIGVTAGPEGIWVTNRRDGTIARIDPATNAVSSILPVGRSPLTIASGAGAVWVADEGAAEVVRVDPAASRVVARVWVGTHPSGLVVAADAVYATSFDQGTVVRIDPATNGIVARQSLGGVGAALLPEFVSTAPGAAALGEGALWVACQGDGSVYRLDPKDLHIVARIPLGTRPSGIATGGGAVWVMLYDEFTVAKIDPSTNGLVGEPIPVGVRPVLAAWGADALWVTNAWSKNLSRIDP
jgi:virginiamycin B lyase